MIYQKKVFYPGASNTGVLYRTTEQHEADKIREENSGNFKVLRALGGSQNILVMSPELRRALSKANYHNTWSLDEKAIPKEWKTWDGK